MSMAGPVLCSAFHPQSCPWGSEEAGTRTLLNHSHPPAACIFGVSLVVQSVKNPPTGLEMQVQSLGWEDPLEEGMATHSITLAGESPWTEEPGGLQSVVSQRVGHD